MQKFMLEYQRTTGLGCDTADHVMVLLTPEKHEKCSVRGDGNGGEVPFNVRFMVRFTHGLLMSEEIGLATSESALSYKRFSVVEVNHNGEDAGLLCCWNPGSIHVWAELSSWWIQGRPSIYVENKGIR